MSEQPAFAQIRQTIGAHDVVLFMKGVAERPQCGFSNMVVQILDHMGVAFHDVNVLADPELREGIKAFTNWPTIPQLYVKGEFVGGCDIVREMFQSGELKALFEEKGVAAEAA
ncbi:MAG TPA: Grx4 family monothiol glutaredoxin [Caulobacterales bacterium]|nr:Grx4 family monothiol glutaredoxin [Caulobacterales bacterium]